MEIRIDGFKNSNESITHLSTHSSPQGKSMEFFVSFFQMDKFAKQMPSMYTPQRCTTWTKLFIWLILMTQQMKHFKRVFQWTKG